MKAPRIAVVGFGNIAVKHVEALRAAGAEVVAACNRSEAGRQRARSDGAIPLTFEHLDSMLGEVRPDAVLCCPSYFEVFPVAQKLLATGIPTLLEKPPGTTVAEFAELRAIAEKHQTPVLIGVNRRHYTVLNRAIEDAGGLSALTHVDVDWSEDPGHFLSRGFTPAQVGRMVFANSLHGIDLISYLAGRIPAPDVIVRIGSSAFDWNMAFQGVSDRGLTVSFRSTWGSPARWRLQFCAPGRRYVFAPLETCVVIQAGVKGERSILPHDEDTTMKAGFPAQARALLEMIRSRQAPASCSFDAVAPSIDLADRLTRALGV